MAILFFFFSSSPLLLLCITGIKEFIQSKNYFPVGDLAYVTQVHHNTLHVCMHALHYTSSINYDDAYNYKSLLCLYIYCIIWYGMKVSVTLGRDIK